jgi:hypothetical protein
MAVAVVAGDLLRFRQVEWKGRPWLWQFALRPPLPLTASSTRLLFHDRFGLSCLEFWIGTHQIEVLPFTLHLACCLAVSSKV